MLLTRAPLYSVRRLFALDLHVLGAPPTFVLSQDQTLQLKSEEIFGLHTLSRCESSKVRLKNPTNLPFVCYSVFKDRDSVAAAGSPLKGRRVCLVPVDASSTFFSNVFALSGGPLLGC